MKKKINRCYWCGRKDGGSNWKFIIQNNNRFCSERCIEELERFGMPRGNWEYVDFVIPKFMNKL